MRERITFIHPVDGAIDPKSLNLQDTSLLGPKIKAIREDKFTLKLGDLTDDLAAPLRELRELHLRWTSPSNHDALEPFASRLSPGLHLSYTPLMETSHDPFGDTVQSPASLWAFELCISGSKDHAKAVFTDPREGRRSETPALFFYEGLETLGSFADKTGQVICAANDSACKPRVSGLRTAEGLDASFDSSSETLKITAYWPLQQHDVSVSASPDRRTEVGILGKDVPPALKPHEIGISGTLTVLGQQKEPSTTLFSFASRHRTADGFFSSKFALPTGLHPALRLSLSTTKPGDEDDECQLYAYLTLPKTIFADRYQLADRLFLASKNLSATPYVSKPVDLEAPAYATETWGSNVLIELAQGSAGERHTAEVPLHLRYLEPSPTGQVDIEVPYPVVFWACDAGAGIDFTDNPFDRLHLGYDGLFSPSTVFWHVSPRPEDGTRLMNAITVPVLADEASKWVGAGTAVVVALGFSWVLCKLLGVFKEPGDEPHGSVRAKTQKSTTKKKQ